MPSSQHVRTPDSPTRHRKAMRSHSALLLPHRTSWHFSFGAAIPKSVWRLLCQFPESPHPQPWILVCRGSQGVSLMARFPFVSSFLILYQIEGEGFFFYFFFYLLRIHFYHIPVFHRTAGLMAQLPCAGSTGLPLCTVGLLETRT